MSSPKQRLKIASQERKTHRFLPERDFHTTAEAIALRRHARRSLPPAGRGPLPTAGTPRHFHHRVAS